jgi:hypothetical protein
VPGIGLITNPRSRVTQRDPGRARRLSYLVGSHGSAESTQSIDDLYRVCEELRRSASTSSASPAATARCTTR